MILRSKIKTCIFGQIINLIGKTASDLQISFLIIKSYGMGEMGKGNLEIQFSVF
jgi:hypothetical protein